MLFVLLKRKSITKIQLYVTIFIITVLELSANNIMELHKTYDITLNDAYYNEEVNDALKYVDLAEGERLVIDNAQDTAGWNYNVPNCSMFSSISNKNVYEFYKSIGMKTYINGATYIYNQDMPFVNLLFNSSNIITMNETDGRLIGYNDTMNVYSANGAVGLGYKINKDILDSEYVNIDNGIHIELDKLVPFDNQNIIANVFFRKEMIYNNGAGNIVQKDYPITKYDLSGVYITTISYEVLKDGYVYLYTNAADIMDDSYVNDYSVREYIWARIDDRSAMDLFPSYDGIMNIGDVKKGQEIKLYIVNKEERKEDYNPWIYFAYYDKNVLEDIVEEDKASALSIDEFSAGYINGHFQMDEDGRYMLSVVDDGGFDVYVDGEKIEHTLINDCFITFETTKGSHLLEVKYTPPGFYAGLFISIVSIFSVFGYRIIYKTKH